LKLEKLAQTSFTQFLINTKLQNNKSNNEILPVFNSYFFTIFILSCSFLSILKRYAQL